MWHQPRRMELPETCSMTGFVRTCAGVLRVPFHLLDGSDG